MMTIVEEEVDLKKTKRVTVEVAEAWVNLIDEACNKSFAPRRTWVVDAIYKKLKSEKLLINKHMKEIK